MHTNELYHGDNLEILRKYIPDGFKDLIDLDPPFNSKADYTVLFKEPTGTPFTSQINDTPVMHKLIQDRFCDLQYQVVGKPMALTGARPFGK